MESLQLQFGRPLTSPYAEAKASCCPHLLLALMPIMLGVMQLCSCSHAQQLHQSPGCQCQHTQYTPLALLLCSGH